MESLSNSSVNHDEFEGDSGLEIHEYVVPSVEIEDKCHALHQMVAKQQRAIQKLMSELEEERNAAASAANEAMSMILRLQRDKADVQMEARQFKKLAEEKISHSLRETSVLEEMLYERDQKILSLTYEVESYRHKMSIFGASEAEGGHGMSLCSSLNDSEGLVDKLPYEIYPSLRCQSIEYLDHLHSDYEAADMEKYAFDDNVQSLELKDLDSQIYELENRPTPKDLACTKDVLGSITVGQCPGNLKNPRKLSLDSMSSPFAVKKEICSDFTFHCRELSNIESFDLSSEFDDDLDDRFYTVDSVCHGPSNNPRMDPSVASPRASIVYPDPRDLEIQKLYARVHALESDRESMRQAIISVGTNKAQMVLLKEIAQNLCKEISPAVRAPDRKQPERATFSLMSIFKWVLSSITFWHKKKPRCRYMFEESAYNLLGMLILLECGCGRGHLEFLLKTDLLSGPLQVTMGM